MTQNHPLWVSYEQDLSRLLVDLDPGERAEVLAGVREHLDASLGDRDNASSSEIKAVLAELGPPEVVAQEAYAGQPRQRIATLAGPVPVLSRSWVPIAVALLQGFALFMVIAIVMAFSSFLVMESTNSSGVVTRSVDYTPAAIQNASVGLLVIFPFMIPVGILTGISELWIRRQKITQLLLLPLGVVVLAALPDLGWLIAGEGGLTTAAWLATAVCVLGGGWVLFRLTTQGVARAQARREQALSRR